MKRMHTAEFSCDHSPKKPVRSCDRRVLRLQTLKRLWPFSWKLESMRRNYCLLSPIFFMRSAAVCSSFRLDHLEKGDVCGTESVCYWLSRCLLKALVLKWTSYLTIWQWNSAHDSVATAFPLFPQRAFQNFPVHRHFCESSRQHDYLFYVAFCVNVISPLRSKTCEHVAVVSIVENLGWWEVSGIQMAVNC